MVISKQGPAPISLQLLWRVGRKRSFTLGLSAHVSSSSSACPSFSMWCYGLLALWAFGEVLSDSFGVQPRGSIGARRTTGSAKDRSTPRICLFSFVARKAGSGSGWPVGGEQANGRCRRQAAVVLLSDV